MSADSAENPYAPPTAGSTPSPPPQVSGQRQTQRAKRRLLVAIICSFVLSGIYLALVAWHAYEMIVHPHPHGLKHTVYSLLPVALAVASTLGAIGLLRRKKWGYRLAFVPFLVTCLGIIGPSTPVRLIAIVGWVGMLSMSDVEVRKLVGYHKLPSVTG